MKCYLNNLDTIFMYFVNFGIVRIPFSLVVVKFASLMKYENTSWPQTLSLRYEVVMFLYKFYSRNPLLKTN